MEVAQQQPQQPPQQPQEPQQQEANDPNAAFHLVNRVLDDTTGSLSQPWIEVFHSRPTWSHTEISFSTDNGNNWTPFGQFKLIDADSIRPGFRVFRVSSQTLQFKLASPNAITLDSNNGKPYLVPKPGRYIVTSGQGCRRVSDAQLPHCLRALRPHDSTVDLTFQAPPHWRSCFLTYAVHHPYPHRPPDQWLTVPMNRCPHPPDSWAAVLVDVPHGADVAFHDGHDRWDSNESRNYPIRLPGLYTVANARLTYKGVAPLDMLLHPFSA